MRKNILMIFLICFSISSMYSQAYEWGNVAMGGGGFVSAVITTPAQENLIFARTDVGGAYRWNETDGSWIPLNDWVSQDEVGLLGIESLAIDPQSPNKVYMLAGIDYFNSGKTAILRSDDYGDSFSMTTVTSQFKAHGNGMGRQNGERLAVDPNKGSILFCGTRRNGLFKSTDSGVTWSQVSSLGVSTTTNDNGICIVLFDKASATTGNATQTIYVGVSRMGADNFYKSTDGGNSWTAVGQQPTTYMPQRMSLSSDGNLYITYGNGAGPHGNWSVASETMDAGQIWKYNTTSGAWTNITPTGYTLAFGGICVDPNNANKLVATSINTYSPQPWGWGDRIFVSTNAGASWTELFNSDKIAMSNGGNPWINGHAIHWAGSIEIDPFNSNRVFVTSGNGIFMTENIDAAVSTWTFTTKGIEETVPLDLVSIEGGALVSVIGDYDGSAYNDITTSTALHNPQIGTSTGVDYAKQNTNYVVRVGGANDGSNFPIYYSNNGGTAWSQFATKPGAYYKGGVAASADGATVLWGPENTSSIYRTANNGSSWDIVTGVSMINAYPVADGVNANKFYIFNNTSGAFYVSTNAGVSFSQTTTLVSGDYKKIRVAPGNEGDIWIATGWNGIRRSTNSGTSFSQISGVSACYAIGFGKAAEGKTYPAVYMWGSLDGSTFGIFLSNDEGVSWTRINDNDHEYGGPANGQFVLGDMNVYGRVYMSTAGRGIVVGEPLGTANCKYPSLGDDQTLCETSSITLNSGITEPEYSFVWKMDGFTLSETGSSLDVTKAGVYQLTVSKSACDDRVDEVIIGSNFLTIADQTVCAGETATLIVSETGSYNWYNTADGTTLLFNGNPYEPTVDATTTYYVEDANAETYTMGLSDFNAADASAWDIGDDFGNDMYRMNLNISNTIKFNKVAVYVTTAATNLVFRILDASNNEVVSVSASGLGLGLQYVDVNTLLTPGAYTIDALGTTGGIKLQVDASGAAFTIDGYATLSHFSGWGWHGPFFDLTFSVGNACIRTPVTVTVDDGCTGTVTQDIPLSAGWNLITVNTIAVDMTIGSLFPNAIIVKNLDGFYSSTQSVFLNSISEIDAGTAYLVYNANTETIHISGTRIAPATYSLKKGWNMLGYPIISEGLIDSELSGISSNIITVKNFSGFWEPGGSTNSYDSFTSGFGYFINVNNDCSIAW